MYRTFMRSCRNWKEFAEAEKIEVDTDLTYEEAYKQCQEYNADLTEGEKSAGTKMEFEKA